MIIRELLLKLGLDIDEAKFAKGHLAAELLEKGFEKVVEKGVELVKQFAENIEQAIEFGDTVEKTSQQLGVTTTALQELLYVGKLADVSTEEMSTSLKFLARNLYHAKEGGEEQAKTFRTLGIRTSDATGKLRDVDDVMSEVAEKFEKMPDGAKKTALSMQLFGRSGAVMIPLLNKGRDGLEEMREEAHNLGLVMSEESVKASGELDENLKRLRLTAQGLWRGAISPLLPAINALVKRFLEWRQANAQIMAQRLRTFIGFLIKSIELLGDVFGFLERNAKAVYAILGTSGLIGIMIVLGNVSVATAIRTAAAWALAALPFIAIAAAIAAILLIYDDLRTYNEDEAKHSKKQHSLFGVLKQRFDELYKDRPKPPFLLHLIEFIDNLRHMGQWLGDFKRDIEELQDLLADTFQKAAAAYYVYHGITERNPKEVQKGIALYEDVQQRNKPAIAGGNTLGGGGKRYIPGVSPAWAAPDYNKPYGPELPQPSYQGPATSTSTSRTFAPAIQIYQQPGQSNQELAGMVREQVEDLWNTKIEEAGSGVLK